MTKTRLVPLIHGGGQERGLRPGTENIRGIAEFVSTAKALYDSLNKNHIHAVKIKEIIKSTRYEISDVFINERTGITSPYILNMSFSGVTGESLVHYLSRKGVYVGMGAACRSRKNVKTGLELMGFSKERARSAVRFSFSHLNTAEEAETAKSLLIDGVKFLRR